MAKIIKLGEEYREELRKEFEEALQNLKLSDGKMTFTKSFGAIQRRARLNFTPLAWQKMSALVREFDKEVAWHGIAFRSDDPEKDEYTVSDILVYPQEVTGATVTTDQAKYQTWLMSHDDEVFNNIRMQGHSHVNMAVSPSGVDTALYDRILDQLDDTMFYIFLIWNKRGERTVKIYDLLKNVLFETADVDIAILGDGFDMDAFLADAKGKVLNRVYVSDYSRGWNSPYGGSSWGQPASAPVSTPPAEVRETAPKPTTVSPAKQDTPVKKEEKKKSSFGFGGKHKKGIRRSSLHVITNASGAWEDDDSYVSALSYEDDYDME
jgi:hypothetical protein